MKILSMLREMIAHCVGRALLRVSDPLTGKSARSTTVFSILCVALGLTPLALADSSKPDVVVILCDDFNPFYAGFAGDPDVKTPNLDSLAKQSAVFTRCYSTSAVCMPARTSLISGLYPHNTGCWGNSSELFVSPRLTSMFADFKQAGYTTAMIGKTHWFAGTSFKDQFASKSDYMAALGIDHYRDVVTTFGSRSGNGIYQDFLRKNGLFEKQSKDLTNRLRVNQYVARPSLLKPDQTCDWMMTSLAKDYFAAIPKTQPFALMVGFSNPHSPFDPPGRYATIYDARELQLRRNVKPFKKYGTTYSLAEIRKARAAYLGKITFVDDLLGRLIGALKERGTWDNTILVFTADHGIAVGEHGNIAKGQFWEEVARVPMLMRIPEVTTGGYQTDTLVQIIDLYPTLIEAVGGELSSHVRGRILLPHLRRADINTSVREAAFCEIHHGDSLDYMVVTQRFKWFIERGREHLYDLNSDPFEQVNLIGLAEYEEIAAEQREHLRKFLMTEQVNYSAGYRPLVERIRQADTMKQ